MKVLRLHKCRKATLIHPKNWMEKIALYRRGWRPAELLFVPIEWWEKPKKPRNDFAILLGLKVALAGTTLALIYAIGAYALHVREMNTFLAEMQAKYPPRHGP
jgi:hypothetical protein